MRGGVVWVEASEGDFPIIISGIFSSDVGFFCSRWIWAFFVFAMKLAAIIAAPASGLALGSVFTSIEPNPLP